MVFIEVYFVVNFLFFLLIKRILICIRLFFLFFIKVVFDDVLFRDVLFFVGRKIEGMEEDLLFFKRGCNGVSEWYVVCLGERDRMCGRDEENFWFNLVLDIIG